MSTAFYLPPDAFASGGPHNFDIAADYLELKAVFSDDMQSFSRDIVDALELAADEDFVDVEDEIKSREAIIDGAVNRVASRKRVLDAAYPFDLDDHGEVVSFTAPEPGLSQTAYLVSLILSNLRAVSPLLDGSIMYPSEQEVRDLRQYFQYFATAAIAAEIGGSSWSFGSPRPDGTGFMEKLSEIWDVLKDGSVRVDPAAPASPKDDQVDVLAWRAPRDGLPGFLLVAAQVATGKDWRGKSISHHIDRVFTNRWFERAPATKMIAYHVVPFARADDKFRDDVLVLGNVLHRLRVPLRVMEAEDLTRNGVAIEAFDQLKTAAEWINSYIARAKVA